MHKRIFSPSGTPRRLLKIAQSATFLLIGSLAGSTLLHADFLTGNLSLSSAGTTTIAVNGTKIDFDYSGGVNAGFPPTASNPGAVDGNGDAALFDITAASTGSFGALTGTQVTIHDLDATQQPTGSLVGPGLPLTNFVTFAARPTWRISLREVLPGVFSSAGCTGSGPVCTPTGSPFNLTQENGNQVAISFAFLGTATDGSGNDTNVAGTFSTTLSNVTIGDIIAALNRGDAVVSSANATIAATAVPEPQSLSTMALGAMLIACSLVYRRRRAR